MKYCPKCKYEFEDHVQKCPDCKTDLVDKIEDLHEVESKWVSLIQLNSAIMSDMIREALEENEIVCLEKSDILHSAFAIDSTSIAGGNVEIFVPSEKLEKAKNILDQINARIEN